MNSGGWQSLVYVPSLHMEAEIPKGCSRNTYNVCEDVAMKQVVACMEPSIVRSLGSDCYNRLFGVLNCNQQGKTYLFLNDYTICFV